MVKAKDSELLIASHATPLQQIIDFIYISLCCRPTLEVCDVLSYSLFMKLSNGA